MRIENEAFRTAILLVSIAGVSAFAGCGGGSSPEEGAAGPPSDAPPAGPSAPTGSSSITGSALYEGEVPRLPALKMEADPGCMKKHAEPPRSEVLVLGEGSSLANVFVSVTGGLPAGGYATPGEPFVLNQDGCRYTPHVGGVMIGQTFRVLNSDGLLHNVHALPKINKEFNRAMPGNVTEADYVFDREEFMFKIKCDVHPWMNAYVAVMPHPYFSVTSSDGRYEISGLAAGTYDVEAWHERLGSHTATVTVTDGGTATADFTFTR